MASTLQTTLSSDFESTLAKFVTHGPLKTQDALEAAIFDLLIALQGAESEVPTLLLAVSSKIDGLLEAVITSRNDPAFTFRGRVLKTVQSISQPPDPAFSTCAERLGIFFFHLPRSITLDCSVITRHLSFSVRLASPDPLESEYLVIKRAKPVDPVLPKPARPVKVSKRKVRYVPLDLFTEDTPPVKNRSEAASQDEVEKPASSPVAGDFPAAAPSFIEQLKDCLESLFEILNPPTLAVQDPSARRSKPRGSDPKTPVVESPKLEARSRYGNTLAQHDLARYLGDTTKTPLGDWPVVVSQGAIKQVRRHSAGDQLTFSRIEKMMRQLSRGRFTESSHAKLLDKDHGVPIFTADVGGDLRLVYHIDFGAPADAGWESQFIRIFGVYPALKIDLDFWKAVSAHLSGRGDEYIRRTETPALSKPAKIVPPLVFRSLDASQGDQAGAVVEINEAHRLELHRILSLEKFIPLSHTFFDAIQKFNEASFMFTVSPHENQIIQHPSSCLVLGRSGTGKTTCMVFRMIGLDIAAKTSVSPQTLRQVFVTQSRTLARKVRLYCAQLMQTETNSALASAPKPPQGLSLLDMDENAEEEGALPKKFSQLDDCHFPLFVTYDQLCNLLEADFDLELIPSPLPTARTARAKNKKSSARQPLISFNYFDSKIWPHMDHRVKRGLHSALVYSEFMGIIKGSEASLSKPRHYLDQSEYEGQSNRSLPGDGTERSRVYTLFEAYRKLRPSASYDIADRTHLLMKILRDQGVPGKLIDFLYVDEAQDNLIIDSALLRTLCPNPHGLFFAGDTAQTISVGSAFRFSELKAFLYRLEREDVHVKRGGRPPVDPAFFQLSTNYRSHGGIVKAAAFIVSLLESYFQHSIDSLAPEVAHVDVATHRPLFFSGMRDHDELLKLISGSSDGQVELGAHQVIIVRHKEAAAALKAAIGRIGVVLTLYESKGMEFNDVLLYNFFTDSTATDTDWRALLLAQQEDRQFNSRKHSILQSELKSFYVGLTRARARVWVWEETYDSHPMENLLVNSGLATSYDPGETVERLVATNADDEWTEQAKEYFSKSLFLEAEFCFRQAKETWWADVAQAYDSRQDAMRLSEKHINRSTIFSQVAKTFERLVQEAKPTEDSESIRLLLSNAAECYSAIPDHVSAAHRFLQAGKETQAAYHFRMAGMFDEAIRVVERHTVDPDLAESIMYAAKFVFSSKKDPTSLHKARKLCADKEEFLEFLQDNGFEEQHVIFLDSITEHEEAAQVLWDTKDYVSAVTRFCQARTLSSRQKATRCLLEGLRANIPFATGYRNQPGIVSDLFKLTSDCEMSAEEKAEIDLLHAITNLQTADLDRYSQEYFEAGNIRCALLALDAWTQSGPLETIESATADQVADILLLCQKFGWVVNFLVRDTGFIDRPDIQTLFNISPTEQGMELEAQEIASQRVVQPRSFIFQRAVAACQPSGSQTNSITLPKNAVDDLVRRALLERMNALIEKVDTSSRTSRPFEICTKFLTAKSCTGHNDRSCWRDHISQKEITIQQFNTRFRLHLLCVALVDYWTAIDGSVDEERNRANKQKIWISRLFRLCYPSNFKLGNLSDVTPELIPEYTSVMPIVKSWFQEVFRSLRPGEQSAFFLTNLLTTSLLATALDYKDAITYLWRGQWSLDQSEAQRNGLIQDHDRRPVVGTAIHWFARGTLTRTNLGVHALGHLVTGRVWLDVGVAVAFAEEVCGQLILTEYYHTATAYEGLVMPRSWIIRAFAREPSFQRNGSLAFSLVTTLEKFLKLLLLKGDPGKLQIHGKPLKEATPPARGQVVARLCRCLALIGHNIVMTKERILAIFKDIMASSDPRVRIEDQGLATASNRNEFIRGPRASSDPQVRTEYHGYATACNWNEVIRALRASSPSSVLDELIVVRQKERVPGLVAGMKTVFCPDEKKLLLRLKLADYPPTIALQCETLLPNPKPGTSSSGLKAKVQRTNARVFQKEEDLQLESEAYTEEAQNAASFIQAFFRRHRRRAGGPIAIAFDELATTITQDLERSQASRDLLLCLRGPLPHVLTYLKLLHTTCLAKVNSLTEEMKNSDHERIEELRERKDGLRAIHRKVKRIIKDIHPSSEFYSQGRPEARALISGIVERVQEIPSLIIDIRGFAGCPEDTDYDLGIEPLLSERVPWAPTAATNGDHGAA